MQVKRYNKRKDNYTLDAFFILLRAGLWEQRVRVSEYEPVDFEAIYKLADEQSVVGLVAAGLEHIEDMKVTKQQALPFMKRVISLESRNLAMNVFIAGLVDKMRHAGIFSLLVKGQGVAQCYARPQWRAAGDVDFFLDSDTYEKAKTYLIPFSSSHEPEGVSAKHFGLTIDSWVVELHGALRCGLSSMMDRVLDSIQKETFMYGEVRAWKNGATEIFLPNSDNDIIILFTHFIKHFYMGGIGLRQICDWCRLLWTYREKIKIDLLSDRLQSMKLMTEWKAFAAYAVNYLGMPPGTMPLYDASGRWTRRAKHINSFIIEVGNFGHNRDFGYFKKYPYMIRKAISLGYRIGDLFRHARVFPLDSLRFFPSILFNGLRSAARGE